MVVIALYASGSKGKSQTLKSVIHELVDEGSLCSDFNSVQVVGDVRCCIETSEGKKICITTSGDDGEVQKDNLAFVSKFGVIDAWITATRTKGESVEEIWRSSLAISEVYWVHKTICDFIYKQEKGNWDKCIQIEDNEVIWKDQMVCNTLDAKRIIRVLKQLI